MKTSQTPCLVCIDWARVACVAGITNSSTRMESRWPPQRVILAANRLKRQTCQSPKSHPNLSSYHIHKKREPATGSLSVSRYGLLRQQDRVDHVDDTIRGEHIGDEDLGWIAVLSVDGRGLAVDEGEAAIEHADAV
jgi:hypothetical protein